jgi:V8-like Glu-specific endopeptidase
MAQHDSTNKHRHKHRHETPPATAEELLALQDEPDRAMPKDVQHALATPRLYVSGVPERSGVERHPKALEDAHGSWQLPLPDGAALGLPGRSQERIHRGSARLPSATGSDPFRPDWSGISFEPRLGPGLRVPRLKTIKGKTIQGFYGIYDNPDKRQIYYPNGYPWRCTGRIFAYTSWPSANWSWWGSGTLVGPRHVITAGHVAPWGAQTWAMLFIPAYWSGASLYGAGAQSYVSDFRGWNTGGGTAHDSCVLRLYEPIGEQLGWVGTKTYSGDWNNGDYWTMTGYPGAFAGGERPVFQGSVPVLDNDGDGDAQQLEHHGDSSPGESGGPVLAFWSGAPYAVGVTSGGETISGGIFGIGDEDNNIAAGGKAMVDLVIWAQANWP